MATAVFGLALAAPVAADQVINDDLIVDGSTCIGFDCVNGESFGFDTLRLKENNLRIKFQDTSNSASFPSNDWQITANDTSNGGANKFSIDDIDGGRTPFTLEAGAPSHSLFVDDGGRVGFGTNTPVVDLHAKSGNTPTLRLEQDGSSGFSAQTWDVASNETNFFIRDASNGSTLPVRIRPGAPTSALDIAGNGDVGLGTSSPASPLHVDDNTLGAKVMLNLENNGATTQEFNNTEIGSTWKLSATSRADEDFMINTPGSNPKRFLLTNDGDLIISGVQSSSSDRRLKTAAEPVRQKTVLGRVLDLELSEWQFRADDDGARHLGPMAQDFHRAFGLGSDRRYIAATDMAGVALASIQELARKNSKLTARIRRLEKQVNRSR